MSAQNPFVALVRQPGSSFAHAISEYAEKNTIHVGRACEQHRVYVQALQAAGLQVVVLSGDETWPDGPFVEDTALLLPDRAWICSLKAESRRGEPETLLEEIGKYRRIERIHPPAFIDGGDVLNIEGTLYVGLSKRTNRSALEILARHYPVIAVPVLEGLHLKSSASYLGRNTLVIDPTKLETAVFSGHDWIAVEKHESANCLSVGNRVLMPTGYPRLAGCIREKGFDVVELPIGEFEKADGGMTCLSLIIPSVSM